MLKAPLQTDCGPSSIRSACQLTGRNAFPGAPRPTMSYSSVLASPLRPASSARPVARRRVEGVRARRHHPRIIKIVADDRGGGRFADIVARVEGHVSEAEGDQRGADLVGWLLECQRAGGDVRLIGCTFLRALGSGVSRTWILASKRPVAAVDDTLYTASGRACKRGETANELRRRLLGPPRAMNPWRGVLERIPLWHVSTVALPGQLAS
eukprot:2253802-Prymnesium_polylepis.2